MLKIRKRSLPEGWYPDSRREIERLLAGWVGKRSHGTVLAGVVPHAGWSFCGAMIADVAADLPEDIETVVVLGGHNPPGGHLITCNDDRWELPTGVLERDSELAEKVSAALGADLPEVPERSADNTIEIIMPILAALHPGVRWAAWRVPSDLRALKFGRLVAGAARSAGRRTAVVGSTDLTHYGYNYGFRPPDSLGDPEGWVKKRDQKFLEALAGNQGEKALSLAESERSACSAGGAAAAMAFAEESGLGTGRIRSYSSSRDILRSKSFVGYGTVTWESA